MTQILQKGSKNLNTENWEVYHPNGKHMFTCGETKAYWYIKKNLANIIGDNKIQFTFKPKGEGFSNGETFGLAGRIIQCVVTGKKDNLQRHHIVPYCYRTHFPVKYKTKNHHDIVLVTYKIHEEYEMIATNFKNELADMYDVKTLNEYNLEYTKILCGYSHDKVNCILKFNAIFANHGKIPPSVIENTLKMVSKLTGIALEKLMLMNYIQLYKLYLYLKKLRDDDFYKIKKINKNKFDHGYHLVKKLNTHDKIETFVKLWRQHFIDTMNPKYMPEGWNVDFKCKIELL